MKTNCAPIVLFVYNRPKHTYQTVEALKQNLLSKQSKLIIFSDAPGTEAHNKKVKEVRRYIHQITGFESVKIVERKTNFGLARSIIEGVSKVIQEYGRVIVLEDDLETSPYFLSYMNDALEFYKNNHKVMHVSGYRYPADVLGDDGTFFLYLPMCWGWATWKRAWDNFEKNTAIMKNFDRKMIKHFNFDNSYNYWKQLESNESGEINTWFVFWYATLFLNNGLALFPANSLVRNIGFDNSGTHCVETNMYDVNLSAKAIPLNEVSCVESRKGFEMHKKYFMRFKIGIIERVFRKLRRIFHV